MELHHLLEMEGEVITGTGKPNMYYIWSIRMNAWIGAAGGTSDAEHAKQYAFEEALEICRRQRDGQGNIQSFPVPVDILTAVRK